jgi:D-glycero-alpha-D-manno-heptose-7-phosphate kinase
MVISRAPVRISFFGGGTDYPEHFLREGGAVLATAIDKFNYITASPFLSHLFDYSIRVSYRKVELAKGTAEIEHNVYRECLKCCGLERDIELHAMADLPAFTGLGSSSAFTVALLQTLHAFKGEFVTPEQLAYEAIYVERHLVKDNVGCQDQVMAAFGGFNVVEFRSETDITVNRVTLAPARLEEFRQHLFLVFTGIRRKASDVVAPQIKKIPTNGSVLLRMRKMVDTAHDILIGNGPVREFGELLHQAWQCKRSLDGGVSSGEIDELYQRGLDAGAFGGKLLGAGGGGFLLFFAPPEVHGKLARVFEGLQLLDVRLNAPGSQIIYS